MYVWLAIIFLLLGLAVLCWSGDRAVLYTQRLARLLGLNTFFLGFVLLAVATGLPELAVVISSLIEGAPYLSVGDLIGSNFTDVALVLGLSIVIAGSLSVRKDEFKNIVAMWLFACGIMGGIFVVGQIGKIHGFLLLGIYGISLWYLWRNSNNNLRAHQAHQRGKNSLHRIVIKLIGSLTLLLVASQICVRAAITIVQATALTYEVFGTTILAVGTSLPEIILNVSAARRRDVGLAIGNSLGSVVEQGALLFGILSIFSPDSLDVSRVVVIAPFIVLSYVAVGYCIVRYRKIPFCAGVFLLTLFVAFISLNYLLILFH
jgi:cation:H+ antiporter